MTQEEKEVLIKDLCARLPYHPRVKVVPDKGDIYDEWWTFATLPEIGQIQYTLYPYLRPMSSMTDEEKMQLKEEQLKDTRLFAEALTKAASGDTSMRGKVIPHFAADWCNKNHFDFRGLIPMGLALEAKEGMYD